MAETTPTPQKRKPPAAGRGRKKGEVNKTTAALKEAILLAAEQHGEDGKGKGKLTGYLLRLAAREPKAFAGLLGKVLPLQVTGEGGGPVLLAAVDLTDDQLAAIAAAGRG